MPNFEQVARKWLESIDFAPNTPEDTVRTEVARDVWIDIRPKLIHPLADLLRGTYDDGHHDGYTDCQVTDR